MKTIQYFGVILISVGTLVACGGETKDTEFDLETTVPDLSIDTNAFVSELAELEDRINKDLDIPKQEDLKEAIAKFQEFAAVFPNDSKAPDYLLRASDFALATDQPEKSVKLLKRIINEYPEYNRMEDVKYNRASHLDFELRDTTQAKEAYAEFIESYPNSPLINDCKSRIENIRYSMEELTEMFIEQLENNGGQ